VKERIHKKSEIPSGNGSKPVIPDMKPENAKKHIRRSGKRRRRKLSSNIGPDITYFT